MSGIETVVERLVQEGINGELWLDGSFLTRKMDPEDADMALCVDGEFYNNCPPNQRSVIDWVKGNLKSTIRCDSYMFSVYPDTHKLYWVGEQMKAYWMTQFGLSRGKVQKGIAVIMLH